MSLFLIFTMIFQDVQHMDETGSWHSTFQHLSMKAKANASSQKIGKSAQNRIYNRYRDVVPYDHSLVRLRNSDTDYINANFVEVASIKKQYILTQGPLASTCKHFWQMVWEQNTYSIVMLNRVVEKNQLKCHQYWPLEGSLVAGNIKVTVGKEDDYNEFIVRVLELENLKEGSKRSIHHFHYVAWPDFGVPSSPQAFLKYLLAVQDYQSSIQHVGPPVIHCSAGIGRSGTFALIDAALTEIQQKDDMMTYDVKAKLLEMRTYRPGLIQTTEQLHFSYIAILEGANVVAPAAYGTAYWSMAEPEEDEPEKDEPEEDEPNEEESNEEEYVQAVKRKGSEQDEQPEPKEPKKEPIAAVEELSDSESGEDEAVSLSDVEARLANDNGDQQAEEESGEHVKNEAGDAHEEGGDENSEQLQDTRANENEKPAGHLNPPEIFIDTSSAGGQLGDEMTDILADKNDKVEQLQQKETPSYTVDKVTESDTERKPTDPDTVSGNSAHQHEHYEHDDATNSVVSENRDDFQASSASSVCSGHFSSDFNIKSSEDVISTREDFASSSQSVEKVVNRWQCQDNDDPATGERTEPRPKRSAMRRNSLEGAKRKSVTFVPQVNGDAEVQNSASDTERDNAENVEERETESSQLRRRTAEERKQNLANKVDKIKKKMQDSEQGDNFFSPTTLGLALCFAVIGFAYFYYYY